MFETLIQGNRLRWLARVSCSVSFFLEGYQAGILGGVQDTSQYLEAIDNPTGTYVVPMIASSYTLAAAVMSVLVVVVGMPLGRRNSIMFGNILIILGGIIQAATFSVAQIIVARVISGFGIGVSARCP